MARTASGKPLAAMSQLYSISHCERASVCEGSLFERRATSTGPDAPRSLGSPDDASCSSHTSRLRLSPLCRSCTAPSPAPGSSRAPRFVALLTHGGGGMRSVARLLLPLAGGSRLLWHKKGCICS